MDRIKDKFVLEPVQTRKISEEQREAIIPSFMFLKDKFSTTGKFEKLKRCLIAD